MSQDEMDTLDFLKEIAREKNRDILLCAVDRIVELEKNMESRVRNFIELTASQLCREHASSVASMPFSEFDQRISGKCIFCHENRIAELERVLAIAENSILECRGGLRVCDGLLGGRLNVMGAIESAGKALAEIKSVLGKGE